MIKLALCQMKVTDNKADNLDKARLFIERAKEKGADIVVLPEMFNCPYEGTYFSKYAEIEGGESYSFLKELSKGIILIGGTIPELDRGLIYNTSYVFEDCVFLGKYRKINLFDVDYDNLRYRESDFIAPGDKPLVADTSLGRIGIAICFDLRFPELFRKLEEYNPFLYIIPAAFNKISGPAHYKLLGRSRALDQESYLTLCSPASNESAPYDPYGHSMIIDPWGEVLNELNEDEAIALQNISIDKVNEIRKKLPLKKQLIY